MNQNVSVRKPAFYTSLLKDFCTSGRNIFFPQLPDIVRSPFLLTSMPGVSASGEEELRVG
ncbi:hypothetical protein [Desulfonema magnum]|uniref:Uncharacterized protein n=1 Tax=Desulfonema magnum TaxID=45655 RepID=A0A975BKL2_9BACT|nr:hypothetical protein [Desulfonema magnum]QTA87292.1 Uncharacterized protein dnm_033220 [Desulfonema magnum]